MAKQYRYLFGPVPSRRFGQSLGVDLTPYKTCSLDCVFCQLGRTVNKTTHREAYVPIDAVLSELDTWLRADGRADYITLSGSGEPTLHAQFGEILAFIHHHSSIPAALLTNGTLLHQPQVRESAGRADVVKISLSAWDQTSYERVNRPHSRLRFDQLIEGQIAFRAQFKGRLWMEVFLMEGINSQAGQVRNISALCEKIAPDRIHLNTAVRPPSEDFVMPLSKEKMSALVPLFQTKAELAAAFRPDHCRPIRGDEAAILAMLRRRPCTAGQIADGFDMHLNTVSKYLGKLLQSRRIRAERGETGVFYTAIDKAQTSGSKAPGLKTTH